MNILTTKTLEISGLTFVYSLVDLEMGMQEFSSKWELSEHGEVCLDNNRFTCNYYTIGEDCTVEQAQQELERDQYAFDVSLNLKVFKNNTSVLKEDYIVCSDYSDDDEISPEEFLDYLINNYADTETYLYSANENIEMIIENLSK